MWECFSSIGSLRLQCYKMVVISICIFYPLLLGVLVLSFPCSDCPWTAKSFSCWIPTSWKLGRPGSWVITLLIHTSSPEHVYLLHAIAPSSGGYFLHTIMCHFLLEKCSGVMILHYTQNSLGDMTSNISTMDSVFLSSRAWNSHIWIENVLFLNLLCCLKRSTVTFRIWFFSAIFLANGDLSLHEMYGHYHPQNTV